MNWINEFTKASFSLYTGNTISAFQPLDFFHFYGLWYDLWLKRVVAAMEKLDAEHKGYAELKALLPTPSNMRALIQKAIPAYIGSGRGNKELYFRYTNFIARMLMEACPQDPFGMSSTPLNTPPEIRKIISEVNWQTASSEEARVLGKLITSTGSLVHGLYNDVVTDFGWDTYGPYPQQEKNGSFYTLLIRNFPDLRPQSLWPNEFLSPYKSVQIFQLYQDVEWLIACVGCHTMLKSGDPITGLKHFCVVADGQVLNVAEIKSLIMQLAEKAENIYSEIRKKNFEELKQMVMLQECYQLKNLFDAAALEWQPSEEMVKATSGKLLQTGILPQNVMMTDIEEYKKAFRLLEFETEVLNPR